MPIDKKVIKKAAEQYLARKVRALNRLGAKDRAMRLEEPVDGRKYIMWVNEDDAFRDGALWVLKQVGKL